MHDQLRFWDGSKWTDYRSASPQGVPARRRNWRVAAVVAFVAIAGMALWLVLLGWAFGGPAIARIQGDVVSVRTVESGSREVCVDHVTDAGTNYGKHPDEPWASPQCWSGQLEGFIPAVGQCVILQAEGESDLLTVEHGEGCA